MATGRAHGHAGGRGGGGGETPGMYQSVLHPTVASLPSLRVRAGALIELQLRGELNVLVVSVRTILVVVERVVELVAMTSG